MIKLITICILMIISTLSYSQITEIKVKETQIGVVKRAFTEMICLSKSVVDSSTSYVLRYQNSEFRDLVDIEHMQFKGDKTLSDLKKILAVALNKEAHSETAFTIGDQMVLVTTGKAFGMKWISVYPHGGNGYFGLNTKEFNRLFANVN